MKILILGVPCVGKTKVADLLAKKLNYKFFNINDLIKEKYETIDKFFEKFPNDYGRFKEKEKIALNIINNNDNFVMTISLIWIEEIVKKITNTNTISVDLIDNVENIYDRILFYDENDKVMPDSKEYRDKHKKYYMRQIENDLKSSYLEYRDIPKFDIAGRGLEEIIDELSEFILKISKECNK